MIAVIALAVLGVGLQVIGPKILGWATDARLRRALRPEVREAAMIVVGQRVATISDADQILVLEDGEVVGAGTHDELLTSCPTYVEIVDSQLSAEEAA